MVRTRTAVTAAFAPGIPLHKQHVVVQRRVGQDRATAVRRQVGRRIQRRHDLVSRCATPPGSRSTPADRCAWRRAWPTASGPLAAPRSAAAGSGTPTGRGRLHPAQPPSPQPVASLDRDLASDIRTAKALVRRQPRRGVTGSLRLVRRPVDGQQLQGIVREVDARRASQLLSTALPRVRQRDVIDLHRDRPAHTALERDGPAGVRIAACR